MNEIELYFIDFKSLQIIINPFINVVLVYSVVHNVGKRNTNVVKMIIPKC